MLRIADVDRRWYDDFNRRALLRAVGAGLFGLGLPGLLRAETETERKVPSPIAKRARGRARSVIFVLLEGGPAHQDLWDMKPEAPDGIRSDFKPIATTVPGLVFCEHLPRLARQAHHLAFVRSVFHRVSDHHAATRYILTGHASGPENFPTFGAVLGTRQPGRRRSLLDEPHAAYDTLDVHHRKAFSMVDGPEARRAFDIEDEPRSVRERYGLDPADDRGRAPRDCDPLPQLGRGLLVARRLIEAGVRVVTVGMGPRHDRTWDTHSDHFALLKRSILPVFDRAFSSLLADLHERGLLDDTLVVATGEFGRTPRIVSDSRPFPTMGRDHWPHCYNVLFAGGGMPGGAIHGASDAHAAYPARDPVTPEDIAATIYRALGVPPETLIHDRSGRSHPLGLGTPIGALLG